MYQLQYSLSDYSQTVNIEFCLFCNFFILPLGMLTNFFYISENLLIQIYGGIHFEVFHAQHNSFRVRQLLSNQQHFVPDMYRIVNAGMHNGIVKLLFSVQFGHAHMFVNVELFLQPYLYNNKIVQTGCKITQTRTYT
jgi:hypothetical protein